METKFTVEESNLICVFAEERNFTLESRNRVIKDIEKVLPYLDDTDMKDLSHRVIGKLQNMTDEEFK